MHWNSTEGTNTPVIYFPQKEVTMALLEKTDQKTIYLHKDEAIYFSIVNISQMIEHAERNYETPLPELENIADDIVLIIAT